MLFGKVTVKEVNRHLNAVIDELLKKYGQVSSPEFEKELENRTGIGWKQVKNYRNHPEPSQVIRPNSKIKEFVFESRRKALRRILKNRLVQVGAGGLVIVSVSASYRFVVRPYFASRVAFRAQVDMPRAKSFETPIPEVPPKLSFVLPGLGITLRLGKADSWTKTFKWTGCFSNGDLQDCSFVRGSENPKEMLQLGLQIKNADVFGVSILTGNEQLAHNLREQLKTQVKTGYSEERAGSMWQNDTETIELGSVSSPGNSPLFMLSLHRNNLAR